jgi:hypothetical protein
MILASSSQRMMERGFKEAIFHITSSYRCRSSYSDYSSFTEQTAAAAVLLPPLARCRDGHPCFLCRSGRGLRGERKEAAYLPHQLSALNLLLLPAMRRDEFAGRAVVEGRAPATNLRIGLPWLACSSKTLVSCGAVMRDWRGRAPP